MRATASLLLSALLLASCGSNGQEVGGQDDTSYEQGLPAPVEQTRNDPAPAQPNNTVAGGPDERVDEVVAQEVNNENPADRPAGLETGGSDTTR